MLGRIVRSLLTLVGLTLLAAATTCLYLGWRVNRTGSRDRAQAADAIVVLGARVEPNGQPGPDLRTRTLHAVELYRRGLAPYLVCTGGFVNDRLSAASVARRLAIQQGVPAEYVLLADGSMTTSEDASQTRSLMVSRGWSSANVVSHPLHLERARLLFEAQGITVFPSPTSSDLSAIPWGTRAWLTAREVVGILWIGLEELGVPDDWAPSVNGWVYGSPAAAAD